MLQYNDLTNRQRVYVDAVVEHADDLGLNANKAEFSRAELRQVSMKIKGKVWIPNWITHDVSRRAGRGVFNIPEIQEAALASTATSTTEGDKCNPVNTPDELNAPPEELAMATH
ncbi:hypothetical protein CL614_01860 [archaeon]|nr:hypothetical protein [archaeon]|tara:strand:+ start:3220 stop:3561 length:342 start_codon:yes stop_codon:yes gene_type:complete